jgi:site-specific DNA-cytosine methylase
MNVLSLFDGISCGQIALERAGLQVDNYFASEIEESSILVTQTNYPNTIQLGDVTKLKVDGFSKIDLLMGGSPCQDLSNVNMNREGLKGAKSKLFWEYAKILETVKPKYFLLENVARMTQYNKDIISNALRVEPILINSGLVSGQNRERLYWTNIPNITQPEDKNIMFYDVIKKNRVWFDILPWSLAKWGGKRKLDTLRSVTANKSFCLTTNKSHPKNYYLNEDRTKMTKLDADEAEILQTLPKGYTKMIVEGKRFHAIGNGWTVDVIAHILKNIKEG